MSLLDPIVRAADVAELLRGHHYLGPATRGWAWQDDDGVAVFTNPNSRHLPSDWLELVRWCLSGEKNAGSRQWAAMRAWIMAEYPNVTTVVSYSDPAQGHSGALYRACGWLWAPTWLLWSPPPSGHGAWTATGGQEGVKDRWVDALRPDPRREDALRPRASTAAGIVRRHGEGALYREPRMRRGRVVRGTGGADYGIAPRS